MKSLLAFKQSIEQSIGHSNNQSPKQSINQSIKPLPKQSSSKSSSPHSTNRDLTQQPPPLPKSRPSLSSVSQINNQTNSHSNNQSPHQPPYQKHLFGSDSEEGIPNHQPVQPSSKPEGVSMKRSTGPCDYQSGHQSNNPLPSLPNQRPSLTSTPSKKPKNDSTFTLPQLSIGQSNNQQTQLPNAVNHTLNQSIKPRFAALNMQDASFEEHDQSIITVTNVTNVTTLSINQPTEQCTTQSTTLTHHHSNSQPSTPCGLPYQIHLPVNSSEGSSISLNIHPFGHSTNQSFNQSRLSIAGFDDDNESCIEISMHMDETKDDLTSARVPRISPRKHLIPNRPPSITQTIEQPIAMVTTTTVTTTTTTYIVPPLNQSIQSLVPPIPQSLQSINQSLNQSVDATVFVPSVASNITSTTSTLSRAAKLDYFLHDCTPINQYLFIGGSLVASNKQLLVEKGITHIVNACGAVCDNYFQGELVHHNTSDASNSSYSNLFSYHRLWLQDRGSEDIVCILYDVIDFINQARLKGGKVLIHCQQGVSRSTVLAIGYLMLTEDKDYDEVYEIVRSKRGITRPNFGFMCQLMGWRKRIKGLTVRSIYLYRFAAHSQHDRKRIVNKWVDTIDSSVFDSRFILVMQSPHAIFVWQGEHVADDPTRLSHHLSEVRKTCHNLQKHEFAPTRIIHIIRSTSGEDTIVDRSLEWGLSSTDIEQVMQQREKIRQAVAMNDDLDDESFAEGELSDSSDAGDTDRKRERDHSNVQFDVDQPADYFYEVLGGRPAIGIINAAFSDELAYESAAPTDVEQPRVSLFEGPPRASLLNMSSPTHCATPRSLSKRPSSSRKHSLQEQSSHTSSSSHNINRPSPPPLLPPAPQHSNTQSLNRTPSITVLAPLDGAEPTNQTFTRPAFLRGLSLTLPASPLPQEGIDASW